MACVGKMKGGLMDIQPESEEEDEEEEEEESTSNNTSTTGSVLYLRMSQSFLF